MMIKYPFRLAFFNFLKNKKMIYKTIYPKKGDGSSYYDNPTVHIPDLSKYSFLRNLSEYEGHFLCYFYPISYVEEYQESPYEIIEFLYEHYYSYKIPKRSGGYRQIDAPSEHLKLIQRFILDNILYCFPCSKYAKAYIKKNSIVDNARYHQKRKLVVKLDVKDFFNSIKAHHIYNFFRKCEYSEDLTVLLTNLCVYKGRLPQGAPTSGYLSNLILNDFDVSVGDYCKTHAIRYTRYADDLTFSGDFDIAALIYFVKNRLKVLGLEINTSKLKVMRSNNRQVTTGIVLNEKLQVPRTYRMKIRQEIYMISKYGLESHLKHINGKNGKEKEIKKEDKEKYLRSLDGKIQFVLSIHKNDEKMKNYQKYIKALMVLEGFSM